MIRDLPEIKRDQRLTCLRASMSSQAVDGFLTLDGVSLRWLSGFTGSAGRLLVSDTSAYLRFTEFNSTVMRVPLAVHSPRP